MPRAWLPSGVPEISPALAAFLALVIVSSGLLLVALGEPVLAAIPLLVCMAVLLFFTLPIRFPLFGIVFLAFFGDVAQLQLPSGYEYTPVQFFLFPLMFENLNKVLPVAALRFSFVDVMYLSLAALLVARAGFRIRVDSRGRLTGTTGLYVVMACMFLCVGWLTVRGVFLRGGDFKQTLWQFRQLIWIPGLVGLFSWAVRDARDFHTAINVMTAAAIAKITIGLHFYFTVARPQSFEPVTLTSHYDSVLFTIVILSLVIRFLHAPSLRSGALMASIGLYILIGVVINNRRLAFVNILVSLFITVLIFRGPVKKAIIKLAVLSMPLVLAYVVVGQAGNSRVFKPAKLIMSVWSQNDRSSSTRDIENFNLMVTIKGNKVLGSGFGHEYVEMVKADDISKAFPQYRYQAHNSVLWLWSIGGVVGFTLLWLPLSIGIFLARRAYVFVRTPEERMASALCITIIVTYMMQAWGDLGTQGLTDSLALTLALATSAKLAVGSGAFPSRVRWFARRRALTPVTTTVGVMPSRHP